MSLLKTFILGFALILLSACDMTGKETGANQDLNRFVFSDSLTQTGQGLTGVGTITSSSPVGSVRGARSFRLRFLLEEGGSLSFVGYSNSSLLGGVEVEFQRNFNELQVMIKGGGFEHSVKKRFIDYNASKVLDFVIDVHNNHDDATHVFIWPYLGEGSNNYSVATSLMDSDLFKLPETLDGDEFYDWHDFGVKGSGAFWGLKLNGVEVFIYKDDTQKNNS